MAFLMTRKRHEKIVGALMHEIQSANERTGEARTEASQWRMEYRKIRDRIVDIATHPGATPQIRATLAEFARYRP